MHSRGVWSGDYLVSPLTDWDSKKTTSKKVRCFRLKEVIFDSDPAKITFPMRAALDASERSIAQPKGEDKELVDATTEDDRVASGESLGIRDKTLGTRVHNVSDVVEVETPEGWEAAGSPDFAPGTEPAMLDTTPGLKPGSSTDPPSRDKDQYSSPSGSKPSKSGPWERRSDAFRPDHISPEVWASMSQVVRDAEYIKWVAAKPEEAAAAEEKAYAYRCNQSHSRAVKKWKKTKLRVWDWWSLSDNYQQLGTAVNAQGDPPLNVISVCVAKLSG